jgi:hypothetical protein
MPEDDTGWWRPATDSDDWVPGMLRIKDGVIKVITDVS